MKRSVLALLCLFTSLSCQAEAIVDIPDTKPFERVLALSDVHGMYDTLKELLTRNQVMDQKLKWTGGRTLLVVVGDSIDKGPDSVEVLNLWITLAPQAQKAGGRILVLLGNHEAEFLAYPENSSKAEAFYDELERKNIPVREVYDPRFPKGRFLRGLPLAAKVGKWFFSHSGLFPRQAWADFKSLAESLFKQGKYDDNLIIGPNSVLEAKGWWEDPAMREAALKRMAQAGLYGVVFGHQPKALGVKKKIGTVNGGRIIKIDTGMAPQAGSHEGQILEFSSAVELMNEKPARTASLNHLGQRKDLTEGD